MEMSHKPDDPCLLGPPNYDILLSSDTLDKIVSYQKVLEGDASKAGAHLAKLLEGVSVGDLSIDEFVNLLLKTKRPCIFAESHLRGNGTDWTLEEVSILGDICVALEVTVFDNGVWSTHDPQFIPHDDPFSAHLLFVPGALLSNPNSPDFKEVVNPVGNTFEGANYIALMKRRLVPLFDYVNCHATDERKALVTLPGIGCGLFAGDFVDILPKFLEQTLLEILSENHAGWTNIDCVVFVPYKGATATTACGHISFRVRPYLTHLKSQLSLPIMFEESDGEQQQHHDDFSRHRLYKIVAWDHLSYPGNDYYAGTRHTDDGVVAAATDLMYRLLGVEGNYDSRGHYRPPKGFRTWESVVQANQIQLRVSGNLRVFLTKSQQ